MKFGPEQIAEYFLNLKLKKELDAGNRDYVDYDKSIRESYIEGFKQAYEYRLSVDISTFETYAENFTELGYDMGPLYEEIDKMKEELKQI